MFDKYKKLKLNPNNYREKEIPTLLIPEKEYEKIKDIFDSIFITAKLLNYRIIIFRLSPYGSYGRIKITIENNTNDRVYFTLYLSSNSKIMGIRVQCSHDWPYNDCYYWNDNNEKTQEELLKEIFNYL